MGDLLRLRNIVSVSCCELQYLDTWHRSCPCVHAQFDNGNHQHNTSDNRKFITLFVLQPRNFSLLLLSLRILLAVKLRRLIMLLILYFLCQIFLGGQCPAVQLCARSHLLSLNANLISHSYYVLQILRPQCIFRTST